MELDCAGGRSAENRTRLVDLREDAEEVELVVGVERLDLAPEDLYRG